MDMDFSPEDLAFRDEVRTFLAENLPDRIREGARRTAGVFFVPWPPLPLPLHDGQPERKEIT